MRECTITWRTQVGKTSVTEHEHLFGYDLVFSSDEGESGKHPFSIVSRKDPLGPWGRIMATRAVAAYDSGDWAGWTVHSVDLHSG